MAAAIAKFNELQTVISLRLVLPGLARVGSHRLPLRTADLVHAILFRLL